MAKPIRQLSNINAVIQKGLAAAVEIFDQLDTKEEEDIGELDSEILGNIKFSDVSFAYNSKEPVLANLNFAITKNETVAIVGKSGSGKSTIANLISRFSSDYSGKISVDDISILDYQLSHLRKSISIVNQSPTLFNDTIEKNIAYGDSNIDQAKLKEAAKISGCNNIVIFHCISGYPTPVEQANLNGIKLLKKQFDVQVGLSDHTLGITAPIVAVTQGAKIIEKHFILDKSVGGPDASFSLNEIEFKRMVEAVRESELALGEVNYKLSEKQKAARNYCRSLYIAKAVKKGDLVSKTNLKSVRPGYGMHPKYLPELIGKRFTKDCEAGTRARDDLFK